MELRRSSRRKNNTKPNIRTDEDTTRKRNKRITDVDSMTDIPKKRISCRRNRKKEFDRFSRPKYVFKKRPIYTDGFIHSHNDLEHLDIKLLESSISKLKKLISDQYETYYKNLKKPAFLGSYGIDVLRHPDDMTTLNAITANLNELLESLNSLKPRDNYDGAALLSEIKSQLNSKKNEQNGTKNSQASGNTLDAKLMIMTDPSTKDENMIPFIAELHGIDIQDILDITMSKEKDRAKDKESKDSITAKRNDTQIINNKINRIIQKERDLSLFWPDKKRSKKKHSNMFSEVSSLDRGNSAQFRDIPLLS